MDQRLQELLEKTKTVTMTPEEREAQIVAMAAANGNLTDERITVATVTAARTILQAAEGDKAA